MKYRTLKPCYYTDGKYYAANETVDVPEGGQIFSCFASLEEAPPLPEPEQQEPVTFSQIRHDSEYRPYSKQNQQRPKR